MYYDTSKMIKRIEWVDTVKFLCIICVMISHLESETDVLKNFYAPFYLTGFFFVSGYVYRKADSFKTHLFKKVKGLLWPWFLFSNINILLSLVISLKGNRDIKQEIIKNLLQVRGYGDGLWFIAALFVAFIPFYFFIKWDKPKVTIPIAFILSLGSMTYGLLMPKNIFPWGSPALPWHFEYIFQPMFWMVLGYYFKGYMENKIDDFNSVISRVVILVGYIVVIYLPDWLHFNKFAEMPYSYVRRSLGVLLIILFCKVIKSNKYIAFVGANTLIYFALHGKLYTVIEHVLASKCGSFYNACLDNVFLSSLLAIGIAVTMSLVLIIPAYLINRYLPWMIGRKRAR